MLQVKPKERHEFRQRVFSLKWKHIDVWFDFSESSPELYRLTRKSDSQPFSMWFAAPEFEILLAGFEAGANYGEDEIRKLRREEAHSQFFYGSHPLCRVLNSAQVRLFEKGYELGKEAHAERKLFLGHKKTRAKA
jgi:hypothetical protein